MQNRKPSSHSANGNLNAVKYFIVTLSVAITFGLWGLFSIVALKEKAVTATRRTSVSIPAPSGIGLDLPPIPTLVPYDGIERQRAGLTDAAPTPQPAQVYQPGSFAQFFGNQNANNSQPGTNTGSSR